MVGKEETHLIALTSDQLKTVQGQSLLKKCKDNYQSSTWMSNAMKHVAFSSAIITEPIQICVIIIQKHKIVALFFYWIHDRGTGRLKSDAGCPSDLDVGRK